jgi:hypothetical protein
MVNNVLIRHFRNGIGSFGNTDADTHGYSDEVLANPKIEGDFIHLSDSQLALIPKIRIEKKLPQWGFVLDNSSRDQKTYPCLIVIAGRLSESGICREVEIANLSILLSLHTARNPVAKPEIDHWRAKKEG